LIVDVTINWAKDANETGTVWSDYYFDIELDGTLLGERMWGGFDFSSDGTIYENDTVSFQRVVPVAAGDHSASVAYGRLGGASGTELVFLYDRTISATFVPFDGSGAVPASLLAPADAAPTESPQP
jgi:hypothetical protein